MRRKEERTLIGIQIILGLIVFGTILLQIADSKIRDYNTKIAKGATLLSMYLQIESHHHQRVGYWESSGLMAGLSKPLGKSLLLEEDTVTEEDNEELRELMDKYKTNEIDAQTYIKERGDSHRRKAKYYSKRADSVKNAVVTLQNNPPKFLLFNISSLKSACSIIQLILACLAIIFLGKLQINISKSINK